MANSLSFSALLLCLVSITVVMVDCRHLTVHEEVIGASVAIPNVVVTRRIGAGGIPWGNLILGPLIILLAFPCIWYNERRAAIDRKRLKLAEQICVEIDPEQQPDGTQSNKLIHMSGICTNR